MKNLFRLNRPIPLLDGPTLVLIIASSFLFAMEGMFDFRLKQIITAPLPTIIYVAVGFAAVWQMFRQKFH